MAQAVLNRDYWGETRGAWKSLFRLINRTVSGYKTTVYSLHHKQWNHSYRRDWREALWQHKALISASWSSALQLLTALTLDRPAVGPGWALLWCSAPFPSDHSERQSGESPRVRPALQGNATTSLSLDSKGPKGAEINSIKTKEGGGGEGEGGPSCKMINNLSY